MLLSISAKICYMKTWKMALLVLSGLGLFSVANYSAEIATERRDRKKVLDDGKFWVIAHRGLSGRFPENTMLAFEQAAALPIDAIELDVHSCRDGRIVVIHDPTLDRTTNLTGKVLDYGWEDLRKADAGYRFDPAGSGEYPFRGKGLHVPLLEDVLKAFPNMKFVIEIKQVFPAIEEMIYRLIRKYKMDDRVIVASEHLEPLLWFRSMNPHIATNIAAEEGQDFYKMRRLGIGNFYRPAGDALQIPPNYRGKTVVTPAFVKTVKKKGLVLHVWTVNDPDEMKRLKDAGVNGIITDFPDRLLQIART